MVKINDLFIENKSELKKLAKLKLPLTKEIKKLLVLQETELHTTYYSLIQKWQGKILERTFAVRMKKNIWECQEVMRRLEGNNEILIRNMYYTGQMGYRTVWKDTKPSYYLFDKDKDLNVWYCYDRKYFNVGRIVLNAENIADIDSTLKYCSYKSNGIIGIANYITIYRSYPEIEILAKLNLYQLLHSLKLVQKLKDKSFKKFLIKNATLIKSRYINSTDILYAFDHNIDLRELLAKRKIESTVNNFYRHIRPSLKEALKEIPKEKFYKYFKKYFISNSEQINIYSYQDMLLAEEYLCLDLTLDKNLFPHDFIFWHDFYTKRMQASKNKDINEKMKKQAVKYHKLEKQIENLCFVLPTCTEDLIFEGNTLQHCVGRMSYNEKIANDKSLIIFVREEKNKPLYTMEYDQHKKQILQLYGFKDSLVPDKIKKIVEEKWLPKIKRLNFCN